MNPADRQDESLLHLGTASWSSQDWIAAGFYPQGTKPAAFLKHYAARYDAVEVDSSFYRAPSPALVAKWTRDVPDTFRFAFKVPRSITHDKALGGDAPEEFARFLETLRPLGSRLGFVCLQFGYFNRSSPCPTLDAFLDRLAPLLAEIPPPPGVRFAVEIRNKQWVGPELFAALRRTRTGFVLTEQEWMPGIARVWNEFGDAALTGGDFAYVRLLGERKRIEALTTRWDRIVIDREAEMGEFIPILRALVERRVEVWTFFNNHYAGYGPGSIEAFRRLWRAQPG
jgi:uncharacterized protein YecE (DUF72 family)